LIFLITGLKMADQALTRANEKYHRDDSGKLIKIIFFTTDSGLKRGVTTRMFRATAGTHPATGNTNMMPSAAESY